MKPREFKDAVFGEFARIAQAFSSSKRLEIIDVLAQGERSVEVLAKETGQTVANASRHLQILKNTKLVETRKDGVRVIYRLADPQVLRCWQNLQQLAENRLAEIDAAAQEYVHARDGIEPMGRDELMDRAERGEVVVLDVRPTEEFEAGHIKGAISIPLSELRARLNEITDDEEDPTWSPNKSSTVCYWHFTT